MSSQTARSSWELGAVFGSVWLKGTPGPEVSSPIGGSLAFGIHRVVRPELLMGVTLRGALHSLSISESGETWKPTMLREASVMAGLSQTIGRKGFVEIKGEAAGGGAVLTGAGDIMPFRVLPSLLPAGEVGLAFSRSRTVISTDQPADGPSITIRYGGIRLRSIDNTIGMKDGWASRIFIGIRSGY